MIDLLKSNRRVQGFEDSRDREQKVESGKWSKPHSTFHVRDLESSTP